VARDNADTSDSLIRGIKADDPNAWRRMVQLYAPLAYSWCRKAGLSPEDAADRTQDILRAAWSGIAAFRRDRSEDTFRGWLLTIARNKIIDGHRQSGGCLRARGGTSAHLQLLEVPELKDEETAVGQETAELFRRAMDLIEREFEEHTRQAFWLTTVEDRPPQEVAGELGMTSGAVRQAKYKVLRRLRQVLGDIED
jgi:RNA polymerase sigma-70 factor (ECF subfamily)